MLLTLALALTLASPPVDPIATAMERFAGIDSYRVTLRSKHDDDAGLIRYYYKKPGFVRMEFSTPHKGAVLVYDPETRNVRVRPFDFLDSFVLTFSPDSRLVKSARGHRVDESDIGAFLRRVNELRKHGRTTLSGKSELSGRNVIEVRVEGDGDFSLGGVHRYQLWLDVSSMMPLKTTAFDSSGGLVEEVLMDDLELNVVLNEDLFRL
jgi:outer membrane lipoprotein-sorting protein